MPKNWVWCWNCKGKGVEPSGRVKRCTVCAGNCGWYRDQAPPPRLDAAP